LKRTHTEALQYHPLLTARRLNRLADTFQAAAFRTILTDAMGDVQSQERFRDYIRALVVHGMAIRLKQLFVIYGHGDEKRVLVHAKLPIQFGTDASDVISVFENGDHGDGTTRTFAKNLRDAFGSWRGGALAECPNAMEDALVERVFQREHLHDLWKTWDPRNEKQMAALANSLELSAEDKQTFLPNLLRLVYGYEAIQQERFEFFTLHKEINAIRAKLRSKMTRQPSAWELVSAAVGCASQHDAIVPRLGALLDFYKTLEDASTVDSLSPESRLADQVYRLSACLCVDGCPACLYTGSDIMSDSLAETTLSRRVLERFSQTM
jgi:hypothetical protein